MNQHETEEEKTRQRVERFSQLFSRVLSVLSQRHIKVAVEHSQMEAPAWSGASEVTFNSRLIGELDSVRKIAGLKGLAMHELAHVLYTPRKGSDLAEWVVDHDLWQAFNALEDQRIERMLIGRYPSIANWLKVTIALYLVENQKGWEYSYALLRGRRYLPVEVRRASRAAWHDQSTLDELVEVVDAYRGLVFPRDVEAAKDLLERYSKLLQKNEEEPGASLGCPFGHGERPDEGVDSSVSRPANSREQERDQRNSDRYDGADETEDEPKDEPETSTDGADGDEEADAEEESGSKGSEKPSEGSEEAADKVGGSSAGNGETALQDALQDIVDSILNDEETAKELTDLVRQIGGLPSLEGNASRKPVKHPSLKEVEVKPEVLEASRRFGRELERIRAASEPSWERGVSSGRLNVNRYATGADADSMFDRWDTGREDAVDIECVVLLDNSGSMEGSKANLAYNAMWAVKRALDKVDASTTVLTFNHHVNLLYDSSEKATTRLRDGGCTGGTSPGGALEYATKVLAESERAIKLLLVITDGAWFDTEEAETKIRRLRRAGVLTNLTYISSWDNGLNAHGCETAQWVSNPGDIIGIARGIVKVGIARQLLSH